MDVKIEHERKSFYSRASNGSHSNTTTSCVLTLPKEIKIYSSSFFSKNKRWIILALCCINMSLLYYVHDFPAATHDHLQDCMPQSPLSSSKIKNQFESKFNLLFTFYSFPNIILPLFGGYIVDVIGASYCFLLSSLLMFIGQLLFSLGMQFERWSIMFLGRALLGCGGECLIVSESAILSVWFMDLEIALAFGISTAAALSGSVATDWISPVLANDFGVLESSYFALVFVSIANLAAIVLHFCIDEVASNSHTSTYEAINDVEEVQQQKQKKKETEQGKLTSFNPLFYLLAFASFLSFGCSIPFNNVCAGVLMQRDFFVTSLPRYLQDVDDLTQLSCESKYEEFDGNHCTSGYLAPPNAPHCTYQLSPQYAWKKMAPVIPQSVNYTRSNDMPLIPANRKRTKKVRPWKKQLYISTNITKRSIDCKDPFWSKGCTQDYCTQKKHATEQAARYMSIPFIITSFSVPIIGTLLDKVAWLHRGMVILASFIFFLYTHFELALNYHTPPLLPLIGLGLADALFQSTIWPSISLVVSEENIGLAFGIITSSYNTSCSLFPLIVSWLYDSSGYRYIPQVELFFVCVSVVGIFCSLSLIFLDFRRYRIL